MESQEKAYSRGIDCTQRCPQNLVGAGANGATENLGVATKRCGGILGTLGYANYKIVHNINENVKERSLNIKNSQVGGTFSCTQLFLLHF